MADFKLRRGYDIKIAGRAEKKLEQLNAPVKAAIQPNEFRGVKPRLSVKEGDPVKIGSVLFTDKQHPEIKFVSPLSGTVTEINRGERRMIMEIVVESDGKNEAETLGPWPEEKINEFSRDDITAHLLNGGMWPHIRQRPFNKIADHNETPRDIFISAISTAPLAADPNFLLQDEVEAFQLGLGILSKLTDGKVYLSTNGKSSDTAPAFQNASGVEKNTFSGPHPAGNVGVQIHHIKPIKHGDVVWYVQPYAVALIGKFFQKGFFQSERIVLTAGSALTKRQYYKTIVGAPVDILIPGDTVQSGSVRYISGDVLTGRKISSQGYISFYDHLITVIPEKGKDRKLLGYFRPGFNMPSFSGTFFSSLNPKKQFALDTAFNGGRRAFVQTGDYEKVLPMDILPVYMAKSILVEDIEEMEKLGILELDEEDLALCSYICLSKTDFGSILRQGLDLIEREG